MENGRGFVVIGSLGGVKNDSLLGTTVGKTWRGDRAKSERFFRILLYAEAAEAVMLFVSPPVAGRGSRT
jgi:hypothetical protein